MRVGASPHQNFENLDLRFPTQIVCASREAICRCFRHACELAGASVYRILGVVLRTFIHALLNLSTTASNPFSNPFSTPFSNPLLRLYVTLAILRFSLPLTLRRGVAEDI